MKNQVVFLQFLKLEIKKKFFKTYGNSYSLKKTTASSRKAFKYEPVQEAVEYLENYRKITRWQTV